VEATRFAEDAASHDFAQARAALARYKTGAPGARWEVTSPVSGSVLKVMQKSEGPVALGAPLLEMADARSLEAVIDVLSQDAVAIRRGMPARLEIGAGVPPLAARVRLVEPAAFTKVSALGVEEQRVNVVLDFAGGLERVQTIGDAFRVEAHIVVYRQDDVVKAPVGALFRDGEGWAVFVADQERARKRSVKAPRRNAAEAWIEEGLQPGERVVVYPSDALRDGAKVEVARKGHR
jgi:HlyD family secretion protein